MGDSGFWKAGWIGSACERGWCLVRFAGDEVSGIGHTHEVYVSSVHWIS